MNEQIKEYSSVIAEAAEDSEPTLTQIKSA